MALHLSMMQGKSNDPICRAFEMAEPTVKNHVTSILKALDVTNRAEAVIALSAFAEWLNDFLYTASDHRVWLRRGST